MPGAGVDTDVLVVGYGPVGAVLAASLGQRGVTVTIVDPETTPYPLPRAAALDEESLRTAVRLPGLADLLDMVQVTQRSAFLGPAGNVLLEIGLGESRLGVPTAAFFHQPSFERALRAGIATLPTVTARLGRSVTSLVQEPAAVTVGLDDGSTVRAGWVVGCDGAASPVRGLAGIGYDGTTFAQPWLAIDAWTPAPLRHLPYFSFGCDPRRPFVTMPMPGGHRWELMLLPGEDPAAMTEPAAVRALLAGWVDPSQLEVERAAVFTYQARTATRWRADRVLLAGDAAHSLPPFAGQGLNEGIRDAAALAWRLAEVARGLAEPAILDGYERERRPRLERTIATALRIGGIVQSTNPRTARLGRAALRTVNATPFLGRAIRSGRARPRAGLPRRTVGPARHAGRVLPNPWVRTLSGRIERLDDLLGTSWTLLALGRDPWDLLADSARHWAEQRPVTALTVVAPGGLRDVATLTGPVIEDLDGTVLALLRSRAAACAVVRPDRYLLGLLPGPVSRATLAQNLGALGDIFGAIAPKMSPKAGVSGPV